MARQVKPSHFRQALLREPHQELVVVAAILQVVGGVGLVRNELVHDEHGD